VSKRRRPSLKRLYADLKDAPPNVASLEVTEAGFRVTFKGESPGHFIGAAPLPPAAPPLVPLIPGTPFPDDDSPLDVADLTLHPIRLDDEQN